MPNQDFENNVMKLELKIAMLILDNCADTLDGYKLARTALQNALDTIKESAPDDYEGN